MDKLCLLELLHMSLHEDLWDCLSSILLKEAVADPISSHMFGELRMAEPEIGC